MVFMVLRSNAFKTFMLPNINNADHTVYMDKNTYDLKKSLCLNFEVRNNKWSILADSKSYTLTSHKNQVDMLAFGEKELVTIKTNSGDVIKGIAFDNGTDIPQFAKYDITTQREITIGKDSSNDICYDFLNLVSKRHCTIVYTERQHYLYDTSSNGVFINNRRVNGSARLVFGDIIEIFGLKLVYLNNIIAVVSYTGEAVVSQIKPYKDFTAQEDRKPVHHQDFYFNRSPRVFPAICRELVVVEPPTNPQITKKKSVLLTIGPSLTMAIPMILGCSLMILSMTMSGGNTSAFMFTGLITAFGSAILGSLWAFLNLKDANKRELEDEAQRFNLYSNYLLQISDYVKEKYVQNTNALYMMYPSSSDCCTYTENSTELWNRNSSHEDFLYHRLGIGELDFQVDIQVPIEKFSMMYDSLKDKPRMLYENFRTLSNVPVGVDFSQSTLYGVVGGRSKRGAYDIVDNLIAQIAATTSYTDAKIVFCCDGKSKEDVQRCEYVKWLPHIWSENKDTRYYATNKQEASDVLFELSNIIRQRAESMDSSYEQKTFSPHYFLFISDIKLLDDELICKYIFDKSKDYGVTTFLLTDDYRSLPNSCEDILQNDKSFSGYYNLLNSTVEAKPIQFDSVTTEELLAFAKRISSIKVKEVEDDVSIVQSLTFFEMYGANSLEDFNISERWHRNKTDSSMKALIGKKAGFSDCYLDIHEKHHGPHGLIAGTTGSGKSELIQTFMLSLAINYSPDDIAFFVIDFKGGGMANLFSSLPHMAGQISNLSGNQISRAMISIKSENMRRQRIFNEYGVNNINLYTQLYKSGKAAAPIPHLLIIIDEFAELNKEEPDFMRELISVAQVGRSLGVHLILATQKPSGTVNDNIWSNAKFRLCLRVQDSQDSQDMLHKPDAAYITQAGRCYLQVGNDEIYELFQSGYSGAVYDEQSGAEKSEIVTMITPTGKTALVGSHTKIKRKEQEKFRWYEFLYNTIRTLRARHGEDIADIKLAEAVIEAAIRAGYNIAASNAEIRCIKNFMELMPESTLSEQQAVQFINMKASQSRIKMPELREKTQLEKLVDYICDIAAMENYIQKAQLWMPLLRSEIELREVCERNNLFTAGQWPVQDRWSLNVPVGLYDDPHNQAQLPFVVDFEEGGHLAVCGSISSGKSTFVQTLVFSLAMKYSPDNVNFYLLDFSSGMLTIFDKLPHTGGVIKDSEFEKTAKFFTMIAGIVEERKRRIQGGSFGQYVKTHKEEPMPAIVIVIDNFAGFKEKTDNIYESLLVQLSREGIGYGIYLVFTAAGFGMAEIQNRIGDNFRTVVSLEMSDKFKYMDVLRTTRVDVMPEAGVKGRGIAFIEGRVLEFQTALAALADNDYERNALIEKVCETMDRAFEGRRARPIPHIPEEPVYEDICQLDEYTAARDSRNLIPYAYRNEDAGVYSVDLARSFCYSITGKQRTGKTNVLKLLMYACNHKDAHKVVIEKGIYELKAISEEMSFRYISTDMEILQYFQEITDDFIERNKFKKELQQQGLRDKEIFNQMQKFKPIYIFIADLIDFIDTVYHPKDNIGNMSGFFENIFEKGYLHNIFFFSCVNVDDMASVAGVKAYQSFVSYKTGVHLGGNTAAQRVFNFQNIHYSQLSKQSKKGEGLVPNSNDDTISEKIIIPLIGGKGS